MLIADCKGCKHCKFMIGVGLGVRCSHQFNQQFKTSEYNGLVVISQIEKCEMFNPIKEEDNE